MLDPVEKELSCWIGGTYDYEFIFWDDYAASVPHDFTGWTLSFAIVFPTSGTVVPTMDLSGNSLVISLTATQTAAFTNGQNGHWILQMHDTSTPNNVEYLMHGGFTAVAP